MRGAIYRAQLWGAKKNTITDEDSTATQSYKATNRWPNVRIRKAKSSKSKKT